jgi:hypothetical protein
MHRLLALVLIASTVFAGGLMIHAGSTRAEFTNCASGGSASQALAAGEYVMRVADKDSFVCYATTCVGDAGEKWPMGTVIGLAIGRTVVADGGTAGGQVDGGFGQDISCRSSDSTGDVIFTEVRR